MLPRLKFQIAPLVNEVLDRIPASAFTSSTTTFLDPAMAGGQFIVEIIRKLRYNGHTDENIASRVYGLAEDIIDLNYARKVGKLIGKYSVGGIDTLEEWDNMKNQFDVVIGNPPYQNPNGAASSGKLWPKFVKLALSMTKPGGCTAMIVPNSWTKGSIAPHGSGKMWGEFNKHDIRYINNGDCNHHFDVGVTVSVFVVQNQPPSHTGVLQQSGKLMVDVDFTELRMLPSNIDAVNVVRKFFAKTHTIIDHTLVTNTRNHKLTLADSGKYAVFTNGKIRYTDSTMFDCDEKIVVAWANTYEQGIRVGNYVAGDSTVYMYTNGNGANTLSVLTSKLYRFCMHQMKMAYHNEPVRSFPQVDFTRSWTDDELYAHFKLTQEEIDLIEATIK